jgi:tripartite ATP-independent transporter DctP family solute receptor
VKRWTLVYAIPLLILACALWVGLTSPAERAIVIRVPSVLNSDHPTIRSMRFMAEDLLRRSGGRVRMEVYPNEQLGPDREVLEMIQFGGLGITQVSAGVLENFSPKVSVFSLPYLFRDRDHYWKVLDGPVGDEILDVSLPYRLKGLCYYDAGARSFYTSRKCGRVIRRPDDLKGLQIRAQRSRTAIRMIEVLGAEPAAIPWGELFTALDTGTVDGAENNPPSLLTSRQYEVSHSYSLNEHTRVPDMLVIGVDVWNRLGPEEQGWVRESARASSRFQRKLWEEAENEALEKIRAAGVTVETQVDLEAFRSRAAALYEDPMYRGEEIRDLVRRIRAE